MSSEVAWQALARAAQTVGKIEEKSEATRSLKMKARYGLNPVRLRASVLSGATAQTSVLEFEARGQDVMGVASRKVIDKVIAGLG